DEPAHDLGRLVGGDAARHPEQHSERFLFGGRHREMVLGPGAYSSRPAHYHSFYRLFLCPCGLIGHASAHAGPRRCALVRRGDDVRISEWPDSERPRERLFNAGPAALTDGELIAVLLGAGVRGENAADLARRRLEGAGGLAPLLAAQPAELARTRGLGPARVARIAAAVELGRRYLEAPAERRDALAAPGDAARLFKARLSD